MQARRLFQGETPLLVSIPHMGTFLPPDVKARMTEEALRLPDTDWHLDLVYAFARDMGASVLMATHARAVVDLNRSDADTDLYPGQVKTGLCPTETFDGRKIYREGEEPDAVERVNRIAAYWLPYHEALQAELERLHAKFGYAILYDAHSIRSRVPRLFDGVLPDLNVGTAHGASCAPAVAGAVMDALKDAPFSSILNGRFVGGHITRHYGCPARNIHAVQMEMTQKNYMDEEYPFAYRPEKAESVQNVLRGVLERLLSLRL